MSYRYEDSLEFNKSTAHNGDLFLYQEGKLLYVGNTVSEPPRLPLFKRIKKWFSNI